jgi:hypothetical protein
MTAGMVVTVGAIALFVVTKGLLCKARTVFLEASIALTGTPKTRLFRTLAKGIRSAQCNGVHGHGSDSVGSRLALGILAVFAFALTIVTENTALEADTVQLEASGVGASAVKVLFVVLEILVKSPNILLVRIMGPGSRFGGNRLSMRFVSGCRVLFRHAKSHTERVFLLDLGAGIGRSNFDSGKSRSCHATSIDVVGGSIDKFSCSSQGRMDDPAVGVHGLNFNGIDGSLIANATIDSCKETRMNASTVQGSSIGQWWMHSASVWTLGNNVIRGSRSLNDRLCQESVTTTSEL